MKCFTVKANKEEIVEPSFHHPMTHVAPELYPQPQVGIRAGRAQTAIEIAPGLKVALSPALLASCQPAADDPAAVIIERASVERLASGALSLVPEKQGDTDPALVLLDVGRGNYNSVRYEVGNRVILRARRQVDLLHGSEELALVEIPVGRPFAAYRSNRIWYRFGNEVVRERLQIRFDGQQLKCEPTE